MQTPSAIFIWNNHNTGVSVSGIEIKNSHFLTNQIILNIETNLKTFKDKKEKKQTLLGSQLLGSSNELF